MKINDRKLEHAFKMVEEGVSKGYFPGCAAAVGNKEGVYRVMHYGNRCIYPEKKPLLRDTLFDLASLTKVTATNTLFMIFLDKGLVSVHDRVSDYIDDFKNEGRENITLFNLLTHTAGFPAFAPLYRLCRDYEDAIKYICRTELQYKPGTRVLYSDFSFILLGYILEKIGGERLDKLCKKYVFDPLGMKNTGFNPTSENIAATEIDSITGNPIIGICHDENGRFFEGISGHAGLFSNIDDMVRFADMLINKGRADKRVFISSAAFEAMVRNHTLNFDEYRGLGWCIKGPGDKVSSGGDLMSSSAFGHTGFTGTSMWVDVEKDIYVILLTNRIHPERENTSILRFRRVFHNAVMAALE